MSGECLVQSEVASFIFAVTGQASGRVGNGCDSANSDSRVLPAATAVCLDRNLTAEGTKLYGTWDFDKHFKKHIPEYVEMCHGFLADIRASISTREGIGNGIKSEADIAEVVHD
jgi:hypothetical protein